ncbi:MAG TPA: winged helix-turn-helix domain-containing protein [Candidatus Nanoarchaeia archaeon]|nr:winged helix-turn-helix domain-containing protein [Candidatus Nanoarchaeia archaeon]
MNKRDRITIINDILEFVRDKEGKAKPTHIMYKANLSNEMLNEYVRELLGKEFIKESKDKREKRTYSLTDKGFKFIAEYKQMKGFLASYDLI